MRLTLRTLLAYLDDLLEPSQAKELGAKIQESEMASELVSKIRDVIRKRRLTAPVVSGPGCDLDANLVAEYLDNTLSAEGVTQLEQICLESDVHLAEVAASHQILTLVLGEPVDIGPLSRDRMYALGESAQSTTPGSVTTTTAGQTVAVGTKPVAAAAPTAGLAPAVKPVAGSRLPASTSPPPLPLNTVAAERRAEEPFDRTIPDYLRAPPLWKRSLPLAFALLVFIWMGVLFRDEDIIKNLLGGKTSPAPAAQVVDAGASPAARVADNTAVLEKDVAANATENRDTPAPDQLIAEKPAEEAAKAEFEAPGEQVAAVTKPETNGTKATKLPVDAPPPADADDLPPLTPPAAETKPDAPIVEDEGPPFKAPGPAVAKIDTNATRGKAATKPPVAPAKTAHPEAAPVVRTNPAQYVSPDGIVLHYDADRAGWYQLPHRAHVFADDALAVPEPFDAQIQMGREKHRLLVMGPAMVGVTDPMKDLPMGINLLRGRVVLQPAEPMDGTPVGTIKPLRMLLSIQGSNWQLELADSSTRCGIEVVPRTPRQLDEDFGSHGWSGSLYVWSGAAKIINSDGQELALTAPASLVLATDPGNPIDELTSSKDLPNWDRRLSTIAQKNSRLFAEEFKADESSAHDALLGLVDSRVYALSRLAVSCLGLVGDYEMMLEVLDRNEHHESRVAAIHCLREWINLDPQNRVKLKEAIAAKFYPEEVDVVYRLIWGYQEDDARSKQTTEQLIDWLEHDRLAVRELAWFYVKSLTNRKLEVFDARANPMHLNAAVQKIRKLIEKDGTLLPPLPMPVKPPVPDSKL